MSDVKRKRGRPPKNEPEESGADLLWRRLAQIERKLDILIALTRHQAELERIMSAKP